MNKNKILAKKHGAVVLPYKDLPRTYKLAIGHYMFLDGEAWHNTNENWRNHKFWNKDCPTDKDREEYDAYIYRVMVRAIPHFVKEYGKTKFGVGEIPTDVMAVEILKQGWPNPKINTLAKYKEWIQENTFIPDHSKNNRWPVIMDSKGSVIDGFHRFHNYLIRGDLTIPFVTFA